MCVRSASSFLLVGEGPEECLVEEIAAEGFGGRRRCVSFQPQYNPITCGPGQSTIGCVSGILLVDRCTAKRSVATLFVFLAVFLAELMVVDHGSTIEEKPQIIDITSDCP